jgi:membrane protease YdiL (CAAX protease family)
MAILVELILVVPVVVGLIRLCSGYGAAVTPVILIAGAVVPLLLRRGALQEVGLRLDGVKRSLVLGAAVGSVALLALTAALVAEKVVGVRILPRSPVPWDTLPAWVVLQFTHVAFPEELFFRGYVLTRICELRGIGRKAYPTRDLSAIVFSSLVFGVAHLVVLGNATSVLTFFPAMAMGWLFVEARSLLAPVLFHGLANIVYGLVMTWCG